MAVKPDISIYLQFMPIIKTTPGNNLWLSFDDEADVLYMNFLESKTADDSEMTDDGVIIRYRDKEIVGITITDVSRRLREMNSGK